MDLNTICHIEIPCRDAGRAAAFYRDLFGWKIDNAMGDDYVFFTPESGLSGAFSQVEKVEPHGGSVFYIMVNDIEAYLKKAGLLGASVAREKTEIPGYGWYGHFIDLDGNKMGLFTPRGN